MEITTVGLDIAKRVFQLHGVDAAGKAVLRRKLQRSEVQKVREGGELRPLYVRSSTPEWPLSARSARWRMPQRRSFNWTNSSRSVLTAGTGLHAPKPSFRMGIDLRALSRNTYPVKDGSVRLQAETPPIWTCRLPTYKA